MARLKKNTDTAEMRRERKMESIAHYYVTLAYDECYKSIEDLSAPEAVSFYNHMIKYISKEIAEIIEETA